MEFYELESKVRKCIDRLIKDDSHLLRESVYERTISGRLGHYMINEFPNYDVDCEYDKNIESLEDKKIIYEIEYRVGVKIKNPKKIVPDIIIHKRGLNSENLLVVEMKKNTSKNNAINYDDIKLKAATTEVLSNINYAFGALVIMNVGDLAGEYRIIWYAEGMDFE